MNLASLCTLGMSFLMASFVVFLIKERTIKSKHAQFVSGAGAFVFWSSTFVWDFISYLIPVFGAHCVIALNFIIGCSTSVLFQ